MRIDFSKPVKASLYTLPLRDNDREDPFPLRGNQNSEEIEIEIDFNFEEYNEEDLDYLDAQLTEEEQMLLDFLLPGRPKITLMSSSGKPYSQFIAASISQYESKLAKDLKCYHTAKQADHPISL